MERFVIQSGKSLTLQKVHSEARIYEHLPSMNEPSRKKTLTAACSFLHIAQHTFPIYLDREQYY